ncbi:myosin-8 [Biomphalaria glabrata]|uniref:Myosin tail domain-containing protein n=1 Tax=Biomphalaria glabrata TaxID=6526 RepID=A0A2C9L1Q4_BIOGL|nr:myosin-8-like [Biomphalaria glabrata]
MKEPSPIARQATFNTGLAESEFLLDKPHGSSHRPVVKERDIKVTSLHGTQAYLKNTKAANQNIHVNSNDVHSDIVSPETVPSISLSVRNKVKKKPRIRVPHLDFSTQEATIEEETTQDLLFVQRATSKELNQDLTPRSIRSNTIIVTSPKFRKSSSLTLIPRETPDGRKKKSHEVTIIDVASLNKTQTLADSKSSNEILEYDHITLKSINQTTTKTLAFDKTTTRKPNKRNDQNSLVNQNTDFQAKSHFSRQNTDQEGDSDQHKSIRGNLISGKITQDSQLNSKDKTSKRQNISTDMAESRKYVSEHETFEEVLQDRNSLLKSETTYHKRIRQLEDELKAIVLQCQTLSEENKKLREKLDKLKQENPESKKQIASLVAENSNLNSQNEELRMKVTALEKQLNVNSKHESRISELESKNDALDSRVAELQKENNGLKLKITSLEDKNQIISTTLQEKRKENNDLMRAIKDAPALETKLRESNFKLEGAQRELETIKHDLYETSRLLKNSEQTSEKLKESISEKDSEIAEMMKDRENDRQTIDELKNNVDKSRHELKKYESKNQSYKDLEIKAAGLKSKITSLRAHVESLAGENSKLKQEREEMQRQVERLNEVCSANTNAAADSKKYLKKWQSERDARMKAENEIIQKEKESRSIEKRLKETEQTIRELQKRIHSLEEENEKLKSRDTKDLTSDNNTLKEENKKLRQMLVERNIELTNKKAEIENEEGEGQILYLERKSHLAKVGVHNVSVWSKDEHETREKGKGYSVSFAGADKHAVKKKFKNKDGQNSKDVSPKSHTADVQKSHSADLSPRTVKRNPLRPSAKDDSSEAVKRTSINLPQIDGSSSDTLSEHQAGYFNLYREKLKRKNGRRY